MRNLYKILVPKLEGCRPLVVDVIADSKRILCGCVDSIN
jgi:hypothetical protein